MDESSKHLDVRDAQEGRWKPEQIPEARLRALVPYTDASSVSELQAILHDLKGVLSHLSVRERRHKFVGRRGGPAKVEYVLYAGGNIVGKDFSTLESCLENLGIRTQPIDTLDREFVVSEEVSKVRLEILGLVLGHDPDSDLRTMRGDNWNVAVENLMERAAIEESFDDIPLVPQSQRNFPLKGSSQLQKLHPTLRAHFMDSVHSETPEEDPVELDALIDDTASRFEEGALSLDQAFSEWGIDVDESVEDERMRVPAGKPLGEMLQPRTSLYRWKDGVLFRQGSRGSTDAEKVSTEELQALYVRAKAAAELLWDADVLSRRAAKAEERDENDLAARLRNETARKREQADALPDSLVAIKAVIEINSGFVFRRVMRFLKRRDVRMASAYGPQDLMQEGLLGLYKAIAHYEEGGAASFIGYARFHIDGMILGYTVKHRSFTSLPAHVQAVLHQLYDIDDKTDAVPENGGPHMMSADARVERRLELAKRIFGDKFNIGWFLDKKRREVHQDDSSHLVPLSEIDDADLDETDMWARDLHSESGERFPEITDTKRYLSMLLLKVLTPREEMVIRARFGLGTLNEMKGDKTLEETTAYIGSLHTDGNVTRSRVREIEAKALRKLKHALYVRFGRYKNRDGYLEKYVDLAAVARVFDIGSR